MRFTKKGIMKAAALGSVLVGALAVAAPASAESFGPTDEGTPGDVQVVYDDANDQLCVGRMSSGAVGPVSVTIAPEQSDRGPTYRLHVRSDESKCVSLETAYEDSSYYYQMANTFGAWGERIYFRS